METHAIPGAPGVYIADGGLVTYYGNSKFFACPVNDFGEWNIYSKYDEPPPSHDYI